MSAARRRNSGGFARVKSPAGPVRAAVATPLSLESPSQQIKARVTMRAGIDEEGLLTAPANPKELGWWNAQAGVVILKVHVRFNHIPGAFVGLGEVGPGDQLAVEGPAHRRVWYRVVQTTSVMKGQLSAVYFTRRYDGWLMLITCGGTFDDSSGHYRSNILTLTAPE